MERALAPPRNWGIVSKALQQLKTHLQNFLPSPEVLGQMLSMASSLEGEVGSAGSQAAAIRSLLDYLRKKIKSIATVAPGASLSLGQMQDPSKQGMTLFGHDSMDPIRGAE